MGKRKRRVTKDESIPHTLSGVVEQWKAARIQLANAIQTFRDASSALNSESTRPHNAYPDRTNLETNLKALDTELLELFADEQRLVEECAKLRATRNSSESLVPANKLPIDVLSRIFAIVVGWDHIYCDLGLRPHKCLKDVKSYAVVLSSVCTAWRRVMINTPSFWSHIDLSVVSGRYSPTQYTKLYARRVKDTPIELHVLCEDLISLSRLGTAEQMVTLPGNLRTHSVVSLNLVLYHQDSAHHILLAWVNRFSRLTSLSVKLYRHRGIPPLFQETYDQELLYSKLLHLQTLDLSGVRMDWSRATFSGLVNLKLSSIDSRFCPTLDHLRGMLVASPGLRTLQFHNLQLLFPDSAYKPIQPIHLEKLTLLSFDGLDTAQIHRLLGLIAAGREPLYLNVRTYPSDTGSTLDVLQSWGEQYNVHMLSLHILDSHLDGKRLGQFFSAFKHLQTLNLSYLSLCSNELVDMICVQPEDNPSGSSAGRPSLQRLRLRQCSLTGWGLRRIVTAHPISWLRMDQCHIFKEMPKNSSRHTVVPFRSEVPDDLRELLGDKIPELYIDHKLNVVSNWGHALAVTDKDLPWWMSPFEG